MAPEFEPLTWATLADGIAEELLQQGLIDVSDIFENRERYERNKDGVIRAVLEFEVEFQRKEDEGMVSTDVRYRVKRPKRKKIGRTVFYDRGTFTVAQMHQGDLFGPRSPAPTRMPRKPNGGEPDA